jgi:hypothetical protein
LVRDCGAAIGLGIGWRDTGGVCDGNNLFSLFFNICVKRIKKDRKNKQKLGKRFEIFNLRKKLNRGLIKKVFILKKSVFLDSNLFAFETISEF